MHQLIHAWPVRTWNFKHACEQWISGTMDFLKSEAVGFESLPNVTISQNSHGIQFATNRMGIIQVKKSCMIILPVGLETTTYGS